MQIMLKENAGLVEAQGIQAMLGWWLRKTVDHASNPSPKRISIPRKTATTQNLDPLVWKIFFHLDGPRLPPNLPVVIFVDVNMSSNA